MSRNMTPGGNHLVNNTVKLSHSIVISAVARSRDFLRQPDERPGPIYGIFATNFQRLADYFNFRIEIGGKERLAGNVEGKVHQLRNHIERLLFSREVFPAAY